MLIDRSIQFNLIDQLTNRSKQCVLAGSQKGKPVEYVTFKETHTVAFVHSNEHSRVSGNEFNSNSHFDTRTRGTRVLLSEPEPERGVRSPRVGTTTGRKVRKCTLCRLACSVACSVPLLLRDRKGLYSSVGSSFLSGARHDFLPARLSRPLAVLSAGTSPSLPPSRSRSRRWYTRELRIRKIPQIPRIGKPFVDPSAHVVGTI